MSDCIDPTSKPCIKHENGSFKKKNHSNHNISNMRTRGCTQSPPARRQREAQRLVLVHGWDLACGPPGILSRECTPPPRPCRTLLFPNRPCRRHWPCHYHPKSCCLLPPMAPINAVIMTRAFGIGSRWNCNSPWNKSSNPIILLPAVLVPQPSSQLMRRTTTTMRMMTMTMKRLRGNHKTKQPHWSQPNTTITTTRM